LIASTIALVPERRPGDAEQLARPLREFLRNDDVGDVARRLGARVQRARRRSRSSSPWLPGEMSSSLLTPQVPKSTRVAPADVGAGPITKTFAAREDIEVWTRRLSSQPAPEAELTPRMSSEAYRLEQDQPSDSGEAPPITTSHGSRPSRRGLSTVLGFSLAAAVGIVVGVVARKPAASVATPALTTSAASSAATLASAPALLAAEVASVAETSVPSFDVKDPPRPSPSAPRASLAHSAEPAPAAPDAVLKLTADPHASVRVDGASVHEVRDTPVVALKVPAGQYQITFQSQTLGRPLTTQIFLVAGASRSVHADFREAEPALRIH
jgi:hypothetical protein